MRDNASYVDVVVRDVDGDGVDDLLVAVSYFLYKYAITSLVELAQV
jgi:hypothetical protein